MADRVIFFCTIILATGYLLATAQIPAVEIGDPLGPKAFPYLLGIGLLITAGLLFMENQQARKNEVPHKTVPEEKQELRHILVIGAVMIWTSVYLMVFNALGYLIVTTIYLFGLMAYFNRGKWIANGFISVLFSVGSYMLFRSVLGVSLPKGILNFWNH